MLSPRYLCLLGTFLFLPLSALAAQTAPVSSSVNPPASPGETPGGRVTLPPPPSPVPTTPTTPTTPGGSVNPLPAPTGPATSPSPPVGGPIPAVPEGTPLPEGSEPEKSVVQIFNAYQEPNWATPWIPTSPHYASGTGFLIDGNRIMTNAHVVAWNKRLVVRRYHDPKPYFAHVEFVGQDVDLAVLKVDDTSFYEGMKPLSFGPLPKVRSTVVTYGFPAGGEQISYTRGVVSRIEVEGYVHIGNRAFLAVQTDAAINPGNSGGPVIQDDKVVGVAFEGISGLQNTGYFIPTAIIHHFLNDIADGTYDGVPDTGLQLANLQNPAFRRMLKLPDDSKQGVRVDQILDVPETKALLRPNDVIMQVGDYPVAEDGTITYEGNTIGVSAAFDTAQNNGTIPLKIWRDGKMLDVKLPVKVRHDDDAEGNQYDVDPRYYIYGGLVFTTLSLDYLKTFGSNWSDAAGHDLIYELFYRHLEDPAHWRPEPVVLASILDHPVNANFTVRGEAMIDKINGVTINRLTDVPKALASTSGNDILIEFLPDHHFEVMHKDEAEKANSEILATYAVPSQSRL
ncbi:MAG TPA: trypsin-like peptidase domain-containing protein [Candidatus Methylacidiphilales bacterium]|nr:trypsin-like peptidase domain-containing protein [Candidatus Methylacidiphilales bacterium]